jgi:hypothetical protein
MIGFQGDAIKMTAKPKQAATPGMISRVPLS